MLIYKVFFVSKCCTSLFFVSSLYPKHAFAVGDGNVLTFSNQFSHELLIVVPYVELTEWSGRVESRRILFSFDVGGPSNFKFGHYKSMVSSSQFA